MNPLRMLGLAAIAALALIALVGSSTASATVLCKNNFSTTSCSDIYGVGTAVKAGLTGTFTLETEFKTIECSQSTIEGQVENAGSSTGTVTGKVGTLTFGSCNCTVTVLKKGSYEFHIIGGTDNATMTTSGEELTVACSTIFGTVHCIYISNNDDWGQLIGGTAAVLTHLMSPPRLPTNSLCDWKAVRRATYNLASPQPLYAAAG